MLKRLIIVAAALSASFVHAQTASTTGVFENVRHSGDWMFAEVRELDGRLSGCFMSTPATDGAFSFEHADLNVLSLRQGGETIRKIAIVDIADETATEFLSALGWFLQFGSPGGKPAYLVALAATERNDRNRFGFERKTVDSKLLDAIANQRVASFSMGHRTLVYSLKGSGKAVALWRECDGKLH